MYLFHQYNDTGKDNRSSLKDEKKTFTHKHSLQFSCSVKTKTDERLTLQFILLLSVYGDVFMLSFN